MSDESIKSIKVNYLARVEGEGAFHVKVENDKVLSSELQIFEPPRFFEGFLVGRSFREAPDITARICGICPVAYQMSSVHAMEKICGYSIDPVVRELRRLLYCGEWIESHALHTFMLHAPDFLGYPDALEMAREHKDWVVNALKLKKAGNHIVNLLGGREIHPINVKLGGFYKYPENEEFERLIKELEEAKAIAGEAALWMTSFDFPNYEFDYEFVSLFHENEYPMNEGKLISNKGLDISIDEYEDYFTEEHKPYSTTLQTILDQTRHIHTGPLARFNNSYELLDRDTLELSRQIGLEPGLKNPFKSILVRLLETYYACQEALRIIKNYKGGPKDAQDVIPKAGKAGAVTEAPRGILFHAYEIDDKGLIKKARIVAPTSHNQKIIEDDLKNVVEQNLNLGHKELTHRCEQAVRNYDPCISCSTHFLKLDIERA